jgi:hypothetical protein
MRVEYPIELFNNFNKSIWTNKVFSYFLIAIIICYTVLLRLNPDIYYKYLFNPIVLVIIVGCVVLITRYNIPLGFILTVSLIALYYPNTNQIITHTPVQVENFENQKIKVPVPGEDKNIVDDEKLNKKKKAKEEDEDEGDVDEEDDKPSKESFEDEKNEIKDVSLEKLNPGYYSKKNTNTTDKKKQNNKSPSSSNLTKSNNNKKIVSNDDKNTKAPTKTPGQSESFLGDVRNIMKDLDTGKNGINAVSAVKKINNLFYNKHKTTIKKMIEEDDDEDEESEDDDFF